MKMVLMVLLYMMAPGENARPLLVGGFSAEFASKEACANAMKAISSNLEESRGGGAQMMCVPHDIAKVEVIPDKKQKHEEFRKPSPSSYNAAAS